MNQLLDRHAAVQAHAVLLHKSDHFANSFALHGIESSDACELLLFAPHLQRLVNYFLGCAEVTGLQFVFDDLFLFRRQIDVHSQGTTYA